MTSAVELLLIGAVAGLGAGAGLLLLLHARRAARPTLAVRIAPHVRQGRRRPTPVEEARGTWGVLRRLAAPVVRDGSKVLEKLGSSSTTIRDRLVQLGSTASVEQFRVEQAVWAAIALAAALVAAAVLRLSIPLGGALVVIAAVLAPLARDRLLTRAVAKRQERLQEQLPDIAEMLVLSVGAGESAAGALHRVAELASGDLADELRLTVHETQAGTPLTTSLAHLGKRTGVPGITRFADGVAVAVERGTPLSEVLRAQAADARATRRRELMELGGKKEISMMAPVVFLILPVTVVFALFPGLAVLQVGV